MSATITEQVELLAALDQHRSVGEEIISDLVDEWTDWPQVFERLQTATYGELLACLEPAIVTYLVPQSIDDRRGHDAVQQWSTTVAAMAFAVIDRRAKAGKFSD